MQSSWCPAAEVFIILLKGSRSQLMGYPFPFTCWDCSVGTGGLLSISCDYFSQSVLCMGPSMVRPTQLKSEASYWSLRVPRTIPGAINSQRLLALYAKQQICLVPDCGCRLFLRLSPSPECWPSRPLSLAGCRIRCTGSCTHSTSAQPMMRTCALYSLLVSLRPCGIKGLNLTQGNATGRHCRCRMLATGSSV